MQHAAAAIRLDVLTFAGHSLRVGFAMSAARAGKATGLDLPRDSAHRAVPFSGAARCWWTRRGLNPHHPGFQSGALPLSYEPAKLATIAAQALDKILEYCGSESLRLDASSSLSSRRTSTPAARPRRHAARGATRPRDEHEHGLDERRLDERGARSAAGC